VLKKKKHTRKEKKSKKEINLKNIKIRGLGSFDSSKPMSGKRSNNVWAKLLLWLYNICFVP
jgi:hypothetical protein